MKSCDELVTGCLNKTAEYSTFREKAAIEWLVDAQDKENGGFGSSITFTSLGTIQILRQHVFDLFRPTHLISRRQHFFIATLNMTSAFPHTYPTMNI